MNKNRKLKIANNITKIIANILIISGVCMLLFIYLPFIRLLIPSTPIEVKPSSEFTVMIPSINARSKIVENVNPWEKSVYQKALQKGVAHARGTSFPGEAGTIFLFAHSSDVPWRITRTNTPFMKLPLIKNGDEIFLSKDGTLYRYKVIDKQTISPYDVSFLENTAQDRLILQTCTPPGTDWKRLLVFAELQKN